MSLKIQTELGLHSKRWFSGPDIIQGTCDMPLDLNGFFIIFLNSGFEDCIVIQFQPKY